ncbi:hypothetical protein NQZ68_000886 [Dissostichus eleginoides]|nr:hypothetical protein NQZ68_000886 [Dissostichus eleginoides]
MMAQRENLLQQKEGSWKAVGDGGWCCWNDKMQGQKVQQLLEREGRGLKAELVLTGDGPECTSLKPD